MQDMGWHDDVHHNSRVLSSRLATDAASIELCVASVVALARRLAHPA